jgi:Fe2+ transport system protein B
MTTTAQNCIVVIGRESVGKSRLIASLTGAPAYSANFRGSTVRCDTYTDGDHTFIDTPGILYESDSATTRAALSALYDGERVLLVVPAMHIDHDLRDMLPLVANKPAAIAITHWDKVTGDERAERALSTLHESLHIPILPLDARHVTDAERHALYAALDTPGIVRTTTPRSRVGWQIEPKPTLLDHRLFGVPLALLLLLLPAITAVWTANTFAGWVDPLVQSLFMPLTTALGTLPAPFAGILAGRYGLTTMFPLLFVWAVPTVVLYALFLGAYKASGLIDRVSSALHPLTRPLGLSGRDIVRVLMGFGCNVPAVVSTRACSACSRGTCISAIAFGAACSYQFGATLGVFSAMNRAWLVTPYLLYLVVTTLIYTRLISPREARSGLNSVRERRTFLELPAPGAVWREARGTLRQFFLTAIPIFILITFAASLLDWLGVLNMLSGALSPVMSLFNLPADAALPMLLASIRKDGVLLFAEPHLVNALTPLQALTGVYLAGVLLPCLVTALTIAREKTAAFALRLMVRQAAAAVFFAVVLAWGGVLAGLG